MQDDNIKPAEDMENNSPSQETGNKDKKDNKKKKDKFKAHSTDITEENCSYSSGEALTFVNIRFPGNAKAQPFLVDNHILSYRQKVMAMSDRGVTMGYVNSLTFEKTYSKGLLPIRKILRIATDEDVQKQKDQVESELKAENICLKYIKQYKLNMTLTHVEIMQFGKKAVFYFNAPERVDFRDLVKSLVSDLKMRIELRQITVRDRSAAIGAIGACGRQCCCSSFLKGYGNVSIKMAKNQSLALLPNKINGVCGQLKCCIRYEDDVYSEKRKNLPEEGFIIKTQNGDTGKVLRLQLLAERFTMLTDKGQKRLYDGSQYDRNIRPPRDYHFPNRFDHIVDETSELIGKAKEKDLELREIGEDERDLTNFIEKERSATSITKQEVDPEQAGNKEQVDSEKPKSNNSRSRNRRPRNRRPKTDNNKS